MSHIGGGSGNNRSRGGTQLMTMGLESRLPADLLQQFQICLSPLEEPDPERVRILWLHIPWPSFGMAFSEFRALKSGAWRKFHKIVFVSNWQAQQHIDAFEIPWSRCVVIPNAIEPISVPPERFTPLPADQPIRLIYTSVPSRGLDIVGYMFHTLAREREDVELDVYSSYKLYGWDEHDQQFEDLYSRLRKIPRIRYHGAVPNHELRAALLKAHVFAYPATCPETSCLALIEAMSAGLMCVHPNYGGLFETAGGWTQMYQFDEDPYQHAAMFYKTILETCAALRSGRDGVGRHLAAQKQYADYRFTWSRTTREWTDLLVRSLKLAPEEGMEAA
jgi:UDP-glucose:(glucosyl)LPS alpha-1,2-glucosyltransferase